MTTFVLVPGFWLGAWAWRPVTAALRAHGHEVYPLSLTGMGERAHLARPDTDLDVHVTDVVNLLRYEDLHDVVLVGHSYAGAVVTTAAADRMTDRIAQLVFVDTGPLPDGAANEDFTPPQQREHNAAVVADHGDGWRLPPPPWAELAAGAADVDESVVALLAERSVAQPWATATSPVRLTGAWEKLPRLGVLSSFTAAQAREMAATMPLCQHMAGDSWRYEELPTWHWPMLSRPAELAEILHRARPTA
ncbi:alpha/beta fold hydrolase [Micromonospora robiginosa]|uniref:Alpha/beta hydrolase n=1 Tax=Micromonospora robiginosa TaxID=2749844 RepID=A0A7L6B3J8_9ACTN|nr:alpha/beta hydrolase [Micromonospora ferruginea]QLQ36563.1 alpha/beta hydrolase [Micromonospora ferruginea]